MTKITEKALGGVTDLTDAKNLMITTPKALELQAAIRSSLGRGRHQVRQGLAQDIIIGPERDHVS